MNTHIALMYRMRYVAACFVALGLFLPVVMAIPAGAAHAGNAMQPAAQPKKGAQGGTGSTLADALASGQLNDMLGGLLGAGAGTHQPPARPVRTFNELTDKELGDLRKLERDYFYAVRNEALRGNFLQWRSSDTFLQERVGLLRQRHRARLDGIISHLYGLHLSDAFITAYVQRLREDVVDYTLDALLNKAAVVKAPGDPEHDVQPENYPEPPVLTPDAESFAPIDPPGQAGFPHTQ